MLGNNLIKDSVIVSGVIPGAFFSDEGAMARFEKFNPDGYADFLKTKIPNRKMPLAEDFWPMISFLSTQQAYVMAGALVPLDGGQSVQFSL